ARFIHEDVYPNLDFIPAHSSFRNFDIKLEHEEGHNVLKDLLAPNTPAAAEFRKLWESARKDLWAP
ncbi:MAG: hypothetical protein ACPHZA_17770, partial [Marinobacter adhaerens]